MLRDLFSLFPAHAGVILSSTAYQRGVKAFPRTCGGDPVLLFLLSPTHAFSPHMRG